MTWRAKAACLGMDPDIFFPHGDEDKARAICATCPVLDECRDWAISDPTLTFGIFGGLNYQQRLYRRKRDSINRRVEEIPHGTERGYRRCLKALGRACHACRTANNEATNRRRSA